MDGDDEVQRVRGYLLSQAARLTVPELIEKLRRDALPLREAAASVPAARFHERPGSEDWSAAEVFGHILDMTEHGAAAIGAVLDGERHPPAVQDRISAGSRPGLETAEDCWRAFVARREPFYERVSKARGDEHLDVHIVHSTFGPLNWREWMLFMRVHDLDHLRQIQAIAARFARG